MIEVYRAVKKDGTLCPGTLTVDSSKKSVQEKIRLLRSYRSLHHAINLVKVLEDGKDCFKRVNLEWRKNNHTGIRNVVKQRSPRCRQGFTWVYSWTDENGDRNFFSSVNLEKLEQRAKEYGLPWEVLV